MTRTRRFIAAATTALLLAAIPAIGNAAEMPGDACTVEGQIRPLGNGAIQCVNGVWQPSTTSLTSAPNIKNATIFKPVGVALSQSTFGSTGKQVADASAFLLPSGR